MSPSDIEHNYNYYNNNDNYNINKYRSISPLTISKAQPLIKYDEIINN